MQIIAYFAYKNRKKNPYTFLLYKNVNAVSDAIIHEFTLYNAIMHRYDIYHIHWPGTPLGKKKMSSAILRSVTTLLLTFYLKLRGTKVIWTVHNIIDHETYYKRLSFLYWKIFIKLVDGVIHLSEKGKVLTEASLPIKMIPNVVIPHGHYKKYYPKNVDVSTAKRIVGIKDEKINFMYFGAIRRYKNLEHLIDTFCRWNNEGTRLIIVGPPTTPDYCAEISDKINSSSAEIGSYIKYIPEKKVQLYFLSTDVVILPYKSILNSGAAFLSLSFDRPVVLPNEGAMPELQEAFGSDWVYLYNNLNSTEMDAIYEWVTDVKRVSVDLSKHNWEQIACSTVSFYEKLTNLL